MAGLFNEKDEGLMVGPILVPPRHTQRFRMEFPSEIPVDTIHCSVVLMNDDEESIAVRDVAIRKGDRCFCVWHCDCVCLGEDPKLLCREMTEARQAAAGLSPRDKTRRSRSICYKDCVAINLFVVAVGVIMILLFLGLVKACLGLFISSVGRWGLDKIIQMPRRLERYYEPGLQGCAVVYDDEGWPVHPDSRKRTVRQTSQSLEFILNLTIFITLPCLFLRNIIKMIVRSLMCRPNPDEIAKQVSKNIDMQDAARPRRRRRRGLRRWMTTEAEELSGNIWKEELLTTQTPSQHECLQPLLSSGRMRAEDALSSCLDTELDDTEYVLTQMQKSKESLARSQRKNIESLSSTRKQLDPEAKISHTITH